MKDPRPSSPQRCDVEAGRRRKHQETDQRSIRRATDSASKERLKLGLSRHGELWCGATPDTCLCLETVGLDSVGVETNDPVVDRAAGAKRSAHG